MKLFKIIALSAIALFSFSCTEEDNYLSVDPSDAGIFLRTISNNSTLFTPSSFSTSKIDLNLELGGNTAEQNLDFVNVYLTYKDSENVFTGGEKLVATHGSGDFTKDGNSGLLRKNFVYTTQQVFTALGITDNSVYDDSDAITIRFEAVAKDGKKYTNTNLGLEMTTAYYKSPFIYNFTVLCPFNQSLYNGDYEVVEDSWADYLPGNIVPVVAGPNSNQFKIMSTNNPYIANTATSYILVTVTNTTSGAVTISSNEPFNYGSFGTYSVAGSGTVNLCNGDINLTGITFGGAPYSFRLKKK